MKTYSAFYIAEGGSTICTGKPASELHSIFPAGTKKIDRRVKSLDETKRHYQCFQTRAGHIAALVEDEEGKPLNEKEIKELKYCKD